MTTKETTMQTMKLAAMAAVCLLAGCGRTYESALKTEKATVLQLAYIPESHGHTSGGVGMSMSGNAVVTFGESVYSPEVWAVVFRCEDHRATFSLTGKDLYQRATVGQQVTLEYVEILHDEGENTPVKVIDYNTKRVVFP